MPISLSCTCGGRFKVKDELVGKRVKCPQCGTLLEIPQPNDPVALEANDVLGLGDLSAYEQSAQSPALDPLGIPTPSTPHPTALGSPLGQSIPQNTQTGKPASAAAGSQPQTGKKKSWTRLLVFGGLGVIFLILVAVLAAKFLIPEKRSAPLHVDHGQPVVESVWVVLSNVQQQNGTKFTADWQLAHGPIDAQAQYYWIVESSNPVDPVAKYVEFPVDLNQQQGSLEGTSQTKLDLEPNGFYTSYIAAKNGNEIAKVSGVLKLGQSPNQSSPNQTAPKSPREMIGSSAAAMDIVIAEARVNRIGADNSVILVDFEILREIGNDDLYLVVLSADGKGCQFEATSNLRERGGTLMGRPVDQQLFQRRPLQVYIEARPREQKDWPRESFVAVSNVLILN